VAALAVAGQQHGMVALDAEGRVIRDALLWNDTRSAAAASALIEEFGADEIARRTGSVPVASFTITKLRWLRDAEPANAERVAAVALPHDWLTWRLRGFGPADDETSPLGPELSELTTDRSDASATLAFDVAAGEWSQEILKHFDLNADLFPPVYNTDEAVGTLSPAAARETGLSTRTVVVAGGGDQVMQGIGNGVTKVNGVSANIGTSGQVSFQSDTPILNPALSTNTFCGYKMGRWITMGAIMNAGLCLKWCNQLLNQRDYKALNEAVSQVPPGSRGVVFLPYLNGERTPHLNPDLSGAFVGVNLSTGAAELSRSVMEGVAFALNQCIELCGELGLHPEGEIVASGGGARSEPWLQIQADIFNRPLKVAQVQEQACLGACIAAGVGAGVYKDIDEGCARTVRYQPRVIVPNEGAHKVYEEYYQLFKDAYTSGSEVLHRVTLLGRRSM
jgi:xylulokinase